MFIFHSGEIPAHRRHLPLLVEIPSDPPGVETRDRTEMAAEPAGLQEQGFLPNVGQQGFFPRVSERAYPSLPQYPSAM